MQFPESWLREFCDPPIGTRALADLLTMSGMEVENVQPAAPPFSGVVVGRIVSMAPHPNADRLRVCRVEAGPASAGGPLQIVCGAPNAREGLVVPLALPGAVLPADADGRAVVIESGSLRGVESAGMLCSARELRLSDEHGGLLELSSGAEPGRDLRSLLGLDDAIFTLKLTPNLGHALSVFGVARELAALTGAPLKTPRIAPIAPKCDDRLPVAIEAPELCGRFSGRAIRGVDAQARTPDWMAERLRRCGQRPVKALVDISNYVMFELGRPSHVFDLGKIREGLFVRWAEPGERLELLNGQTVELDPSVGVIADASGVESIAGIMGGERTAVSDATHDVYIEAAFWWPESVAGRSRRFGFATEAGHRFERGVDPSTTVEHLERLTQLIVEICGGDPGPIDDRIAGLSERRPVALRVDRAAKVIGMPIDADRCAVVFERLGFAASREVDASAGTRFLVTPPSWRFDLQIEEDLIEELIRVVGYDELPADAPIAPIAPRPQPEGSRRAQALRERMAGLGYFETIGFGFVEERWERELAGNASPIRLLNPIAAPLSVMRSSLLGSLVGVLRTNLARRSTRVRVFELGRVFMRAGNVPASPLGVAGIEQPMRLAALAYGPVDLPQWGAKERAVDFFDLKGDLESLLAPVSARFLPHSHAALHPTRCAKIEIAGRVVGVIGELHPKWCQGYELPQAPMLFEIDAEALTSVGVPAFVPLPKQQASERDVALVVGDAVPLEAVVDALLDADRLVRSATLFDVYKPPSATAGFASDERSLAIRLELRDDDATLTDERIEAAVADAVERVAVRLGARRRV